MEGESQRQLDVVFAHLRGLPKWLHRLTVNFIDTIKVRKGIHWDFIAKDSDQRWIYLNIVSPCLVSLKTMHTHFSLQNLAIALSQTRFGIGQMHCRFGRNARTAFEPWTCHLTAKYSYGEYQPMDFSRQLQHFTWIKGMEFAHTIIVNLRQCLIYFHFSQKHRIDGIGWQSTTLAYLRWQSYKFD